MPNPLDAPEILDRVFLDLRARLLEAAAMLDRLDRAEGNIEADPRIRKIRQALQTLHEQPAGDLAERLQLLFSIPYDENWRTAYALTNGKQV
jgi:hypothetical protein